MRKFLTLIALALGVLTTPAQAAALPDNPLALVHAVGKQRNAVAFAITAAVTNSYKQQILKGLHDSTATYKIALYTSSATLSKSTTAYSATNEVGNSGSYSAGGGTLSGFSVTLDTDTGILDWTSDPSFTTATITARGALIYNSTAGSNASVAVLDFGSDITSTAGTFTITFPAATAAAGLVRIS
jgi:hypothetical protein